jgi:hypothetical protein
MAEGSITGDLFSPRRRMHLLPREGASSEEVRSGVSEVLLQPPEREQPRRPSTNGITNHARSMDRTGVAPIPIAGMAISTVPAKTKGMDGDSAYSILA